MKRIKLWVEVWWGRWSMTKGRQATLEAKCIWKWQWGGLEMWQSRLQYPVHCHCICVWVCVCLYCDGLMSLHSVHHISYFSLHTVNVEQIIYAPQAVEVLLVSLCSIFTESWESPSYKIMLLTCYMSISDLYGMWGSECAFLFFQKWLCDSYKDSRCTLKAVKVWIGNSPFLSVVSALSLNQVVIHFV